MRLGTAVTHEATVESGGTSVTLRRVRSPNGARIEVDAGAGRTRLDALELETLTWQDADFFADLVGEPVAVPDVPVESDAPYDMQVSNEYTVVRLRVVPGPDGDAVRLTAPKAGYATEVDARVLARLVDKPKTFFSDLLATPYGPGAEHDEMLH